MTWQQLWMLAMMVLQLLQVPPQLELRCCGSFTLELCRKSDGYRLAVSS